jgi:histidinol-phosphate phosphatase family protein
VFLDRDGTLIDDLHYLADPARVRLIDGAADALRRLQTSGYAVVLVTNQSGIARGLVTRAQYDAVQQRLEALLSAAGTSLDGVYMCPHHPDVSGPCECRKPGPGLFLQAAADLELDLSRSVLIGDRWRDIAAATQLGARGMLVPSPETGPTDLERAAGHGELASSLAKAVDAILSRPAPAAGARHSS